MSKLLTLFMILNISVSAYAFQSEQIELVDEVQWFLWHEGIDAPMPHFDAVSSVILNNDTESIQGLTVPQIDFIATEELFVGLEG